GHRDTRFGLRPQDGVYCRPNVIVSMTYLQEQTRSVGPLRILPGSHLLVGAIGPEGKHQPAPGEVLLTTSPGTASCCTATSCIPEHRMCPEMTGSCSASHTISPGCAKRTRSTGKT